MGWVGLWFMMALISQMGITLPGLLSYRRLACDYVHGSNVPRAVTEQRPALKYPPSDGLFHVWYSTIGQASQIVSI